MDGTAALENWDLFQEVFESLPKQSNTKGKGRRATVTWAVYEGDVPIFWLFVPFRGGEVPLGGEAEPLGDFRGTFSTYRGGSTKLGSTCNGTHRWRDGWARETTG